MGLNQVPDRLPALAEPCYFPSMLTSSQRQTTNTLLSSIVVNNQRLAAAADEHVSVPDTLTLAFALLLKAYTGNDTVQFGLVTHSSLSGSSGDISHPRVLSVYLDPNARLQTFATTIRSSASSTCLSETGYEGSDQSKPQAFNTILCLGSAQDSQVSADHSARAGFALTISVDKSQEFLEIRMPVSLRFDSSLLDSFTAGKVLSTYEDIIGRISNKTSAHLSDIALISNHDRSQLCSWNSRTLIPSGTTLNDHFKDIFKQQRYRQAVYTTAGSFTYGQLDDLSTPLAERIRRLGVGRNTIVSICMKKSRWVACAMVAIWKAGGAVTTMDPTYPDKRLQSMLQETMCKLIFVDLEHASRFKKIGLQVIDDLEHLEDDLVGPINHKDLERSWEIADVKPDHLAQVAWTSGSTGRPKGVLHSHGRLTSEHNSYKWNLEYNGGQRVLQFGSYAYVAGVNDTFHTFLHGATLCIPSESERTSCLADFMKGAGVTRAYLTPSVLRTISPDLVPTLKYLCVGGETVDRDLVEKWSNCVHLSSLYGASEGGFMIHQSAHLQYLSQGLLPIGGNAWLVCPNDSEQLVPIGVPGEIIFESHELALGYLNDPQKTAKTFIDPPRWAQKRANLYGYRYLRMGDLARYESDGSIVILGRADNQVKINGQRVELQDVEYHLHQSLPTDSRAIAEIVKPIDAPNTKFLTAFCSLPSGEQLISLEDQRLMIQRLQERLRLSVPAHMVPRAFIFLDDIPGDYKVDRRKLRADASQLGLKALLKTAELSSVPASDLSSTDMESTIAQLWTQILPRKSPHIAPSDNFIALGGDSVAAMRLVSVARANGLALTSQLIFEHPVLSDLAAVMESTNSCSASSVDTVAPASQESSRLTATDFQAWAVEVGAQNGGWIDHFIYDFTGALDVGRLQSSCLQLAMDHPILRAVFSYSAGSVVTFSTSTNMIPFEYHDCSPTNLEATSKAIFYRDRPAALGLPVSRFDLLVVSPMQHRLILRISHAQYDSVSARLIHDHLRHLYLGQPTLPPVSVAEYLRYIQRHSIVSAAKRYWRGSLRGSQMPVLARHSTSSEARHNLDGEVRRYRADLAAALMPKGITLATAVKVAWGATLATLTGQMDVVFGDFVSGRQIGFQDVGRVVCACVNFAAVRVDFDRDGKTWYEVLQQVQREALTGSKHEVLGWRKILGCIGTGDLKRWSSIVNFITVDLEDQLDESRAWDAVTGTEKLEVNVGYEEHQFDKTDLWLLVRRLPGRKSANMEFYLRYSKSRHSRSAVEGIADLFCDTLQSLSTDETLSMEVELPVLGDAERERLIPYKNSCTD